MVRVENDLLAKAGNCGSQLVDGVVVTETVVDSVFYKNTQPLDFGPKHVGLRVAVDQPVLALADQRARNPVARGDIFEILPWNTGCLGAGRGGDRGDGADGMTLRRSDVSPRISFVPMRFSSSPSLVKIWTDPSMIIKAVVRRVAGTVDDLAGLPDNVLVPFEHGLPDPAFRRGEQFQHIRASLFFLGHFWQRKQFIPAERELRGAAAARITSRCRSVAQPGSALYWG